MAASRNVGSRRIFPAMFKLQVLDAYRLDPECKGNQRATARKFNIHRRQIQKWLQCEPVLRANVADALRYDQQHLGTSVKTTIGHDGASRVFKHDARTLKLVAQKLYPSSYPVVLDEETTNTVPNDLCKENEKDLSTSGSLARPTPLIFNRPVNLVTARARSATPPRPSSTTSNESSPLPARVAEIVADSKSSAFSPKRKWLQDSLMEQSLPLPLITPKRVVPPSTPSPPLAKRPCPDFSVKRLCGSPKTEITIPPIVFPPPPPPLLLPYRAIPELKSLHFKPEPCNHFDESFQVKQENFSDDDEPIDVLNTSPTELKSFDFSAAAAAAAAKRRSFSVEFKLNVLDAFYNDKDCNQNQRATARKFNINRRQVQKWLSVEEELRGGDADFDGCAGCPRHCTLTFNCSQNCPLAAAEFQCSIPSTHPIHQLPPNSATHAASYNFQWFNPLTAIY